jgi:hypothetical protein
LYRFPVSVVPPAWKRARKCGSFLGRCATNVVQNVVEMAIVQYVKEARYIEQGADLIAVDIEAP